VRDLLPPAQVEAVDAVNRNATWDAIRFAIAALELGVDITALHQADADADGAAEPAAAADGSGLKRPREAETIAAGAGATREAVVAHCAASGGATRAELAAALGEAGLDDAIGAAAESFELYDRGGRWLPM